MLKHLGLISILLMWTGTLLMLRRHQPEQHKTISKHAAKNHKYHVLYAIVEIAVTGIFALFLFGWFIPALALNSVFTVAATMAVLGVILAAIVPDTGGIRGIIHGIGAYGMAVCLLVMNVALLMSPQIATSARIITVFCTTVMLIGWLLATYRSSYFANNMLRLQAVYFLAYHIPILAVTYMS